MGGVCIFEGRIRCNMVITVKILPLDIMDAALHIYIQLISVTFHATYWNEDNNLKHASNLAKNCFAENDIN